MTDREAIEYWKSLRKTFMEYYEKEERYWGRSHWMHSVTAIDAAISALQEREERSNHD